MFRNLIKDILIFFCIDVCLFMIVSINHEIILHICEEVVASLEDFILDDPSSFPCTMACVRFMEDLSCKGKSISFQQFDSEIISSVYEELGESLKH